MCHRPYIELHVDSTDITTLSKPACEHGMFSKLDKLQLTCKLFVGNPLSSSDVICQSKMKKTTVTTNLGLNLLCTGLRTVELPAKLTPALFNVTIHNPRSTWFVHDRHKTVLEWLLSPSFIRDWSVVPKQ